MPETFSRANDLASQQYETEQVDFWSAKRLAKGENAPDRNGAHFRRQRRFIGIIEERAPSREILAQAN
jgi:hypothetical protein